MRNKIFVQPNNKKKKKKKQMKKFIHINICTHIINENNFIFCFVLFCLLHQIYDLHTCSQINDNNIIK